MTPPSTPSTPRQSPATRPSGPAGSPPGKPAPLPLLDPTEASAQELAWLAREARALRGTDDPARRARFAARQAALLAYVAQTTTTHTRHAAAARAARPDLPPCCQHHDGPHIEGCHLVRTPAGVTHPGPCLLAQPFRLTEHGRVPAGSDRP